MQLTKISIANVPSTSSGTAQHATSNMNTEKRDSRTSSPVSHAYDDTDDINYSSSFSPAQGPTRNPLALNISVHTESQSTTINEHHDHSQHHHSKPSHSSQQMDHHPFPGSLDSAKGPFSELPEEEEDDSDLSQRDHSDHSNHRERKHSNQSNHSDHGHGVHDENHHRNATDDINIVYDDADDDDPESQGLERIEAHHDDEDVDEEEEEDESDGLNNMVNPTPSKGTKRKFPGLQISTDLNCNHTTPPNDIETEHNDATLSRISVPMHCHDKATPQSTSQTLESMELSLSLNEKSSLLDSCKSGSLDIDSLIQRYLLRKCQVISDCFVIETTRSVSEYGMYSLMYCVYDVVILCFSQQSVLGNDAEKKHSEKNDIQIDLQQLVVS